MLLRLLKTRPTGLVALVIPYEWVSRPSAEALRDYIRDQGWSVTVYRFQKPIFDGVLTTASVSIIDKKSHHGHWNYFEITSDFKVIARAGVAGAKVLEYATCVTTTRAAIKSPTQRCSSKYSFAFLNLYCVFAVTTPRTLSGLNVHFVPRDTFSLPTSGELWP